MIVDNNINTSKYVSFKDLAKYVLVSGTTCLNPYTSAFKTLWVESGSGNTRSHQLRHNEAAGYGFTFHDGVNTGNTKLCLPEEMIALNPKIVFGGLSTGDYDDWATFKSIGADTFESEDKVYGRYVFKINFADGTYCTIRFETSYVDQDDSLHDQTEYWYEKCPDNTFYDQNGNKTTESNYVGKELSSFELLSVDLIQGEEHGTINSWYYSGSSLYLNTTRGNYECYSGNSEDGYFTTGVTQNDILVSNVGGYSNKNITVYMTPSIGITFSYTRDSQGCTSECTSDCPSDCPSDSITYSISASTSFIGLEKYGGPVTGFTVYPTNVPSWSISNSSWVYTSRSGNVVTVSGATNAGGYRTGYVTISDDAGNANSATVEIGQAGGYCSSDCSTECTPDCSTECTSDCTPQCSCNEQCSPDCNCDNEVTPVYYTISFYSGSTRSGSSIVTTWGSSPFTSATYEAGDTIVYPTVAAASQTCRNAFYGGWKANQAGSIDAPTTMPSQNVSVYYAVGYDSHTVTWYTRKSDVGILENYSSGTFEYGTSVTYPSNPLIPVGYTWDGWSPSSISSMGCSNTDVIGSFTATCLRDVQPCDCDTSDSCTDCTCNETDLPQDNGMGFRIEREFTGSLFAEYQITIDLYLNNSSIASATYSASTYQGTEEIWISNLSMYEGQIVTIRVYFSGRSNPYSDWSAEMQASVDPLQTAIAIGQVKIIEATYNG